MSTGLQQVDDDDIPMKYRNELCRFHEGSTLLLERIPKPKELGGRQFGSCKFTLIGPSQHTHPY